MCEAAFDILQTIPAAAASPTLVLRLRLFAKGFAVSDILAGREIYKAFARAAPTLNADALAAWEGGARHRSYAGGRQRYCVRFAKADGDEAGTMPSVLCWVTHLPSERRRSAPAPVEALAPPSVFGLDLAGIETLLERAPAVIAVFRLEHGKLIYKRHNRAYAALVGKANLEGMEFGTFLGRVRQDGGNLKHKLLKVLASGKGFVLQASPVEIQRQGDGEITTRYFDIVSEPVLGDDQTPIGVSLFAYDVSAIVRARREAEKKEKYFRHLADNLPQIVWSADQEGNVDWLNGQWYRYCGMQRGDPEAKNFSALFHPEDHERKLALWQEARQKVMPFTMDMRIKDQSGQYRWFLVQVHPIVDELTHKVRWFGSSTDIHDQKMTNQYLEQLLENMNDGFMTVGADWTITGVNQQHTVLVGLSKEEQLGRKLVDVFFPNEQDRDSIFLRNFRKTMEDRIAICFEEYYAPLAMWVSVNFYPTIRGGVACIYRNLSPKRALQKSIEVEKQKFEAVFLNSPACMALMRGPSFIIEKFNAKYAAILGHRPLLGKKLQEAVPELSGQKCMQAIRGVYETGEPFVGKAIPAEICNPDTGQVKRHYFDFTYSRILDNAERPYGVYWHAVDITDKVLASRRADELAISLTEAIGSRDDFLSSASHELKTPVTSIKMQLQMTRRHVKPELGQVPSAQKLAKTLDVCGRQIDRLGALVEDLLDVSRMEAGKMSFHFAPVDLGELIVETLNQFTHQLEDAQCPVQVDIDRPLTATCDGFRIEQVIVNLITNAIKYASSSLITVKAHRREDGGVRISVADQGMGIGEEKQAKIFERFERAISHDNVSGLGLGLFICRQIVEAHRGNIFVSSALGQGSVFTVDLPLEPILDGA